jgi:hypothetical protein
MRWNVILGMMVAVGSMAATEARAQENAAESGATATPGKQDAEGKATGGKATVNADGTLSPKPNEMSKFLKRSRQFGNMPIEMPLVDDYREDGSGSGQTN